MEKLYVLFFMNLYFVLNLGKNHSSIIISVLNLHQNESFNFFETIKPVETKIQ